MSAGATSDVGDIPLEFAEWIVSVLPYRRADYIQDRGLNSLKVPELKLLEHEIQHNSATFDKPPPRLPSTAKKDQRIDYIRQSYLTCNRAHSKQIARNNPSNSTTNGSSGTPAHKRTPVTKSTTSRTNGNNYINNVNSNGGSGAIQQSPHYASSERPSKKRPGPPGASSHQMQAATSTSNAATITSNQNNPIASQYQNVHYTSPPFAMPDYHQRSQQYQQSPYLHHIQQNQHQEQRYQLHSPYQNFQRSLSQYPSSPDNPSTNSASISATKTGPSSQQAFPGSRESSSTQSSPSPTTFFDVDPFGWSSPSPSMNDGSSPSSSSRQLLANQKIAADIFSTATTATTITAPSPSTAQPPAKRRKTIKREPIPSDQPQCPQENLLLTELLQMGFTDGMEILTAIRRLAKTDNTHHNDEEEKHNSTSNNNNDDHNINTTSIIYPTSDEVMISIISQREEMEEARKMDEARLQSEQMQQQNAKLQADAEKASMQKAKTCKDLQSVFPKSWILSYINDNDKNCQKALEKMIDDESSSSSSAKVKNPYKTNDDNNTILTELKRLLKLEQNAQNWYGELLPSFYFVTFNERFSCNITSSTETKLSSSSSSSSTTTTTIMTFLKKECDILESALFKLEEQQGGVPKVFLKAQEEAKSSGGTNLNKKPASNSKTNNNDNHDDDDDDDIIVVESSSTKNPSSLVMAKQEQPNHKLDRNDAFRASSNTSSSKTCEIIEIDD